MLRTGLEFAPGTTDASKRLVGKLLKPEVIMSAYRAARDECNTNDIVLHLSDRDPEIRGGTRIEFCKHLQRLFGKRAPDFKMWHRSAQSVMQLPGDSDAMWLVIEAQGLDVPEMCVIYAMSYKQEAAEIN